MSGPDLIAAAIANRAKRLGQVAALRPLVKPARERATELHAARKDVRESGQRVEFVRSMHCVPGFFPSPPPVVDRMIELAEIPNACQIAGEPFDASKPAPLRVLEPECGKGNIAHAVTALGHPVYCVERSEGLAEYCRKNGLKVQCADFLSLTLADFTFAENAGGFDRVLMNPPFENRQDEQHIRHAFTFLRPGGRLVGVCTVMTAARMSGWVRQYGRIESLPADAFKKSERSTGVHTSLVILNR